MNLHIFNPEHDISLAFGRNHLTVSKNVKDFRTSLGWIPALWAKDGDAVLVDDVEYARTMTKEHASKCADVSFVMKSKLKNHPFSKVIPWGWDAAVNTELREAGVCPQLLKTERQLNDIRQLSNRRLTTEALINIRKDISASTCGSSYHACSLAEIKRLRPNHQPFVLKAPWSSSGRGIRLIQGEMPPSTTGWVHRIIHLQGGIMVEPYYNKVLDFGMEFLAHSNGSIQYKGLSIFHTINRAYAGNVIASEKYKEGMLSKYIPTSMLETVRNKITAHFESTFQRGYTGPFGIDMMIVESAENDKYLLHPCVEINLRMTMGHVALSLETDKDGTASVMEIKHEAKDFYQFSIHRL